MREFRSGKSRLDHLHPSFTCFDDMVHNIHRIKAGTSAIALRRHPGPIWRAFFWVQSKYLLSTFLLFWFLSQHTCCTREAISHSVPTFLWLFLQAHSQEADNLAYFRFSRQCKLVMNLENKLEAHDLSLERIPRTTHNLQLANLNVIMTLRYDLHPRSLSPAEYDFPATGPQCLAKSTSSSRVFVPHYQFQLCLHSTAK